MADPRSRLSALVDPPLAEPPPVAEIERRAKALRTRTLATRGGVAAAVVGVLIGAGMALIPGDSPQTLQTAAPPPTTAGASTAPQSVTVQVTTFELDGQPWRLLATRTAAPEICFALQPAAGEEIRPACLALDGHAVKAAAADLRSVSFVYGIVAPDVTAVTLIADGNAARLDVLGPGPGVTFPVNFLGTMVAPTIQAVDVVASRTGSDERVPVSLPDHLRVSAVHGREAPPAPPSTTVTTTRPRPTTRAPDTPASTAVPPTLPATTIPGGGQPKRVQPVAGATDLRRQPIQSSTASGQSLAVRFWGGVEPCYVLGRVDVTETADKVTITLWTGNGPGAAGMACIQMAAYYETVVQLQAPLGGRTVVDGAA